MTDDELSSISTDPRFYRSNLIMRGAKGPALFDSISQPFQREFLKSVDKAFESVRKDEVPKLTRIWWEASKGASKDSLAAMMVIWLLAFSERQLTIQAGAADKAQADELRRAALTIIRGNDWLGEFVEVQNYRIINRGTEGFCEIIPADETGAHGSRPDVCILNELTHHADEGFALTMMDNAAKVPSNVTVVLTNAGYKDTWQFKWREEARTSDRWAFHSYNKPAPWVNKDELREQLVRAGEQRFRRLWYGEWQSGDESALSTKALEDSIVLLGPRAGREGNEQVFGGLDVGVSQDRTGFAIISRAPEEKTKLASCQSWSPPKGGKVDLMAVQEAVLEANQRFGFFVIYYDPSQCELFAQQLRAKGVPMVAVPFTAGSLQEMASALIETFNSGTIELFKENQLIADLRALRFIERGNTYRLDAARTTEGHADLATAFILALLAAKRNPMPWIRPFTDSHIALLASEIPAKIRELGLEEKGIVNERETSLELQLPLKTAIMPQQDVMAAALADCDIEWGKFEDG